MGKAEPPIAGLPGIREFRKRPHLQYWYAGLAGLAAWSAIVSSRWWVVGVAIFGFEFIEARYDRIWVGPAAIVQRRLLMRDVQIDRPGTATVERVTVGRLLRTSQLAVEGEGKTVRAERCFWQHWDELVTLAHQHVPPSP